MFLFSTVTFGRDDDRSFMEELFNAHYTRMRAFAFSLLHDGASAEDAAQDGLLYIFEHIEKFRGLDCCTLRHLVDLIFRRRCYNLLRARRVRQKHSAGSLDDPAVFPQLADSGPSVEESALLNIDAERMAQAIRRLPPDQRFAIEAKYILGFSDAEIAEELGIKKNSVRQYLTRARRGVFSLMGDENDEEG